MAEHAPHESTLPAGPLLPGYAELHCLSNFSFQRGASHPHELVARAFALGYTALAITDECSVAGLVRAHVALRDIGEEKQEARKDATGVPHLRLLPGSEFAYEGGRLVVLAHDLDGWGGLCEFITAARCGQPKGEYQVRRATSDFALLAGCEVLFVPRREPGAPIEIDAICDELAWAKARFGGQLWLAAELLLALDDDAWLQALEQAGERCGVPLVAAGDVHMHVRSRKPLQDVITAVREGRPVAACGWALQGNAERHLRQRVRLGRIYPAPLLANTLAVAERCDFGLNELAYNYPLETVPPGLTPAQALAQLTEAGAAKRYPHGVPPEIRAHIDKELALIAYCKYEMFFLTVHDIVQFARSQGILCQGRGSAANSVVCYCLGVTAADPEDSNPLFERFISRERREPPDIDVDFEHERREEVIQYIYKKYGHERAAITAVVACYRTRSAIRDVGKALGLPEPLIDGFAKSHQWFDGEATLSGELPERLRAELEAAGLDAHSPRWRQWVELAHTLTGFPRHLSQHVGGFVLTQDKLTRLVPVEPAAMDGRTVIQWDKDDLDDVGFLKVDVLALGMLTALRRCLDFCNGLRGTNWELAQVPREDERTYDMICRADTVGVFQIESRAQMSMLPRLKPREFYDLVVEVAIVRPGPIQGGMVHPYLQRREMKRQGLPIPYEKKELIEALGRTLGIPIFQEQVMQIAVIAAKFTPGEADQLRRSMAAWKRRGGVDHFERRLIDGMVANGYPQAFAESLFKQILGFGEYGFPESHAYSFALLAYASSWLKRHEPAAFLAALLNSQPMGFYSASQLIQDARRHGLRVLPPDVRCSGWDCGLEGPLVALLPEDDPDRPQPAVRLGLRLVAAFSEAGCKRLVAARAEAPFTSTEDLALRADLDLRDLEALAAAEALTGLSGHRRQQVWDAAARQRAPGMLRALPVHEAPLELAPASEGEEIVFDYAALGFTLRRHPLALLRPRLQRRGLLSSDELQAVPSGRRVAACGLVTVRQQPQTAKGTIFVTLEDESGTVNVIVWKHVRERQRDALLHSRLLAVRGTWQCDDHGGGLVRHLVAERLLDLTPLLGRLARQSGKSRDFH